MREITHADLKLNWPRRVALAADNGPIVRDFAEVTARMVVPGSMPVHFASEMFAERIPAVRCRTPRGRGHRGCGGG
jgi:hypothetical protein